MDRVYIISRYTGKTPEEIKFNEQVCRYFCRQVAKQGKRPVAPHLFYTQFTDDNDPQEREQGLRFGIADLDECDEFLVVTVDGVISQGMAGELTHIARQENPKPGHMVQLTKAKAEELIKAVKA